MAYEENLVCVTMEAGQDLSAKQFYFVEFATDGQIDPAGDGGRAEGVLQNKPSAAGRAATVAISGISKVVAGGAITKGNLVSSNSSGKAQVAGTNDVILGVAMETATADGELIAVLLNVASKATAVNVG
jgi:hypothetical protein